MRLLGISDLHGNLAALRRILAAAPTADAILLAGDITHFGEPEDVDAVLAELFPNGDQDDANAGGAALFAISGNCDSEAIDRRLVERGYGLHGRGRMVKGLGVHGVSGVPSGRAGMYHLSDEDFAAALHAGRTDVETARRRLLLCHVPPRGTRDRTTFLSHGGSAAVRQFVEENAPDLVVCGHIHEARGAEPLGATLVVNCGPAKSGCYAVIDLDPASADAISVDLRQV